MAQLNNLYVSSSFQGLLKMADSTNGLTNTLQTVQTGDGDNSPLQISLTQVNISGSFSVNGVSISGGTSGSSGTSGTSGSSGSSGTSGTSGSSGRGFNYYGTWSDTTTYIINDVITYNGQSYVSIQNGNLNKQPSVQPAWWSVFSAAGSSGTSGTSGSSGSSGSSGTSGSSGSSGTSGSSGSSGTSGTSGSSGSSGTSGLTGSSGTSGTSGSSGSSGTSGSSGSSGTSGVAGSSGTSGTSGGTGSSGTSGTSGVVDYTGLITTGSITSTQVITGSLILPTTIVSGSLLAGVVNNASINIFSEAFNSGSVKMNISASNAVSQSNIIFGGLTGPAPANLTGSIVISGSHNIIMGGPRPNTLVTAGTYGYVGGSGNIFNGQSTLTTSSVLRPNMSSNINNGVFTMIFDTGTQAQPVVANNYNVGSLGLTHRSGSATITTNLILGTLNSFASQSFISASAASPVVSQNLIAGTLNLGHTSSSIVFLGNLVNGNAMGVRNEFSSSFSTATNLVNVQRNNILGNNVQIFVTGSPSSADGRNISDNLIGGINTNVTSSHNGSNNGHLHGTIVFGSGLVVSASNAANTGGSAFVGRFNDTGSLHNSNNIVLAVGTGTAAGSRRTGLSIDTGSNAVFSGSLTSIGPSVVSGSIASSDRTFVIHSGSMRMYNESGSIRIADSTNQAQLFFNPTRKVGFFLGQSNMDQTDTQFGITSTSTDNYVFGGNFNNFRTGSNNLMLGIGNISIRSGSNNVILAKATSYTTGSNNLILGSGPSGIDEVQDYFNVQLPASITPIMFKSGSAPLTVTGSLKVTGDVQFASGSNTTMGTFVLNGGNPGTATVSNTLVTANSLIFLTKQTNNHPNAGPVVVSSKGSNTFSVTSNHNGDTDTVAYLIINPA